MAKVSLFMLVYWGRMTPYGSTSSYNNLGDLSEEEMTSNVIRLPASFSVTEGQYNNYDIYW